MSPDRADGAGQRKKIHPAQEAALWALSSGRCYAPGCILPVVLEVRPGVYRKNAQVAHIYGVKGARCRPGMAASERDSFSNLLLLCYPHHTEVDGDEERYPPERLREWKNEHDGPELAALSVAAVPDPDTFVDFLATIAKPPLDRLESITERLEKTGEVTEETVGELRYLVGMISSSETGVDAQSARNLAVAAEILSSVNIKQSASWLLTVSDTLPKVVARLEAAVRQLPPQ
ncbi:hypothetical protein OHA70_33215 [Kribbella sp. NBC_00382]|uniref:hypothetical protein n=1 Tax=Kribbella sp. NBC_00382 TaxID=2975967 RepID=UPI002E1C9910